MRVRMVTTAAGPDGVLHAGEVWMLEDGLALELVRGGYAAALLGAGETLSAGTLPAGSEAAVTASIQPGREAAVLPRAQRRRG